jgi:hypothetical protein
VTLALGDPVAGWPDACVAVMAQADLAMARRTIGTWAGYAPTPLLARPGLARALGLAALDIKDEGRRFGVGSFKALGPPYALERLAAAQGRVTVTAATSGNHGRALAWGAARLGLRCVIHMPAHTSGARDRAPRVRWPFTCHEGLLGGATAAMGPSVVVTIGRVEVPVSAHSPRTWWW